MGNFIDVFIRRPIFASMLILAMVVVGAAAFMNLGVDRLPSVDLPTVSIRTSLPGATPEEVETEVSDIIEEVVNTVDGIDELRSISNPGNSTVIITFSLNRDIESAAQDVRDKVATVLRRLPEGIDPPIVSKFDNDSQPVMKLSLSGDRSLRELTEIADKIVKPTLETSQGVGEVAIVGGANRTINIDVDADRLAAQGVAISTIRTAVERANADVPGGNLSGSVREESVRTMGRLTNAEQFGKVILRESNGTILRLEDVAKVEDGRAEQRGLARLDGQQAVSLDIRRQSGANTIAVINAVEANLEIAQARVPPGVKLEVIRNQKGYIEAALHEIEVHLVLGSILACLVVLAFTRSWRSVIIAGVAIPASVVTTFAVMWALDFTLNSVTMLALVLMVGIVIDDAIVVLENIFRYVEEKKMTPMEAARHGTREIALAVLATTLSLAVIFIPISFMSSITGRFLYQFGITAAAAVMVSLVVSLVLTPTLSARMLKKNDTAHDTRGGFYRHIDAAYTWMLKGVMRFRYPTAIAALLIVGMAIPLYHATPLSYMPEGVDEAEFEVSVEAPQAISFPAMNDVMLQIEKDVREIPQVRSVFANVGSGFSGGVNNGNMHVRLAPHEERYFNFTRLFHNTLALRPLDTWRGNYSQADVMKSIRNKLRPYRDLRVSVRNYPSFNIGGGNFDIDFSISGPDLQTLSTLSNDLAKRAEAIGGLTGINTTLRLDKPELRVTPDRERAAQLGVSANDVGTAIRLMVGGEEEISRFRDPMTSENYDVRLRLGESFRRDPSQVPTLLLSGSNDQLIELQNLATVEPALAPSRIDRVARNRDVRMRATLADGAALGPVTDNLLAEVEAMNMPPAYRVTVRGKGLEFARTSQQFVIAFALSIVFMYMILASQYENLFHPLTILFSLPLSVPFALLSLWLAGVSLNLYSALGLLVLFGVVKKNSILQIDHMNQLRHEGMDRARAIIEGNRDRLRPILMTTLTLVAGMLPLWIGTGPGAEERYSVAVIVIGGQSLALLITLLVTPVAYSLLDDVGAWLVRRRERDVPIALPATGGE